MFQRHFQPHGIFRAGPAGIIQVLGFATAGVFLAALLTAPMVNRLGRTRWVTAALVGAGVVAFAAAIDINPPMAMAVAFLLGFSYQTTKICADTVVQSDSDDAHIGRVYSLYDTTNNVFYVLGFIVGAAAFDEHGVGRPLVIGLGVMYLLTAAGFSWGMRRFAHHPTAVEPAVAVHPLV